MRPGINPEAEIGRFLTDVAHFPNVVPVAGTLEYVGSEGRFTLALLQAHVDNQGDGWNYTQNYLGQFFEQRPANDPATPPPAELHGGYLALVRTLGRRVAELHHALALTSGDQAFDPEPVELREIANWSPPSSWRTKPAIAVQNPPETQAKRIANRISIMISSGCCP